MSEDMDTQGTGRRTPLLDVLLSIVLFLNISMALMLRYFGSQMYPFFVVVYIWISIYALFLTLLLRRDRLSMNPLIQGTVGIVLAMVLTASIRAIFLGLDEFISLDPLWYLDFGKFMLAGSFPYADFYFPYPPIFGYFIYIISLIFPSVDGFRFFAILLDTALIPLIWKLVKRNVGERWASIAVLAYALLPVSVIESGWNGHFEPLVNLFLLLSIWFLFEGRHRLSGSFLGLAAATKIYPILLFPLYLVYTKDWRNRIEMTLSAAVVGALSFLPIYIPIWLREPTGTVDNGTMPSSGLLDSLLGFIITPNFLSMIITGLVFFCVLFGIGLLFRQIRKGQLDSNGRAYNRLTIFLGLVLILLGIISGIYAILPVSRLVYWRYPLDVGFVRGITAVSIGILVISTAVKQWRRKSIPPVTIESLLIMISAILLLLIALSRSVFYGWYLLWTIPLLLLLKDRKLGLTAILCLLLVYPSYTHDNFNSLGFEEERLWSDDMIDLSDWSINFNATASSANVSLISAGVSPALNGSTGLFWFDTSHLNKSDLENLTIRYSTDADVHIDSNIEFVARILSEWDPTFGRYADLGLDFDGKLDNGTAIHGHIIHRTAIFTNLTFILWRSALSAQLNVENITIQQVSLVIYPVELVRSGYIIDFMYTTYYGILNPIYFVMVPSLIALALVAFTLLHLELENEFHKDKETISDGAKSTP